MRVDAPVMPPFGSRRHAHACASACRARSSTLRVTPATSRTYPPCVSGSFGGRSLRKGTRAMRHVFNGLLVVALSSTGLGCPNRANVQCETDPNCDLTAGGICAAASNGNHWCAYPDASCPGGYRYSGQDVGDGLAGVCVAQMPDAGIDDAPPDGDATLPPPNAASCVGLPATCGASGNDSCCSSPLVAGGTFDRGYDLAADTNSGNTSAPATVSSFRLDKYEVTVERFRAFVTAGQGTQANPPVAGSGANPHLTASGWDPAWNSNLPANTAALTNALGCDGSLSAWNDSNPHRPIGCITWYEAFAFCAWDGGFLPTEAQWNYAAAGGDQQRAYPWSSPASSLTLDASHASYSDGTTCVGDNMPGCAITDIAPVGTKPQGDGRWGQSDLGGNEFEWVLDYDGTFPMPCVDCANLAPGNFSFREFRGGSWDYTPLYMRTGHRYSDNPTFLRGYMGIRCARSAP
jgi:formylglycine-generating enzyme required for sulfatase activity